MGEEIVHLNCLILVKLLNKLLKIEYGGSRAVKVMSPPMAVTGGLPIFFLFC